MATIEHRKDNGRDSYRIRFTLDGRRRSVALGGLDEPSARIAKEHIEHLISQKKLDRPPHGSTLRWLDSVHDKLHRDLSGLSLVEPRLISELPRTVIAFMKAHIAKRKDWKKPQNYLQAVNHLERFLRQDIQLANLTNGVCTDWHLWMQHDEDGPKLSPNTAGQNVKRCRQMFREAISHRLVTENPFEGIKIDLSSDRNKDYYVTQAETEAILDACPDQEWRVLFALGRFGGLRVPSEAGLLKWSDIDWDQDEFTFASPKTARYGKDERTTPLFPELRVELQALKDEVEELTGKEATGYVIANHIVNRGDERDDNLRKPFAKILKSANVTQFPKPFMNLRTTRRNELELAGFRDAALNEWIGHDGQTAKKYYQKCTEQDKEKAIGGHSWGQSPKTTGDRRGQNGLAKPNKDQPSEPRESHRRDRKYTPEDYIRC